MDGVSQLEAIHAAGHLNVRKQKVDIRAGLKNGQRLVGVHRFDRSESGVLDDVHRAHAQHHLILDDENFRRYRGLFKNHNCLAIPQAPDVQQDSA